MHSTPCDAMVQVLDGEAEINIGSKEIVVRTGEVAVMRQMFRIRPMPTKVPFKMLLTVVKEPKG